MQSLTIQQVTKEPTGDEYLLYPDYLIGCLLREGMGSIEADLSQQREGKVEFVLTARTASAPRVVGRIGAGYFRSLLAHFGGRFGPEMLYGGHALFSCEFEREGRLRTHRFVVFLCNFQGTAFWVRLYLYGIDGVWPMRDETH